MLQALDRSTPLAKEATSVDLRSYTHRMRDFVLHNQEPSPALFTGLAREAVSHLRWQMAWSPSEMLNLLCRKQHDYGHENILTFGLTGLAVRLSDKVARLANLERRNSNPSFESTFDTWQDIVGYCVIAEMIFDHTFTLELQHGTY